MDENERDRTTPPEPDTGSPDDTEGHGMGMLLAMNAADAARKGQPKPPAQKSEDELPPLSKPWPRMRDDKQG